MTIMVLNGFMVFVIKTLHVLRGSMDGLVHLGMYKGGAESETSACIKGSMDSRMYIKEENILVCPLPLMSKGESDFV